MLNMSISEIDPSGTFFWQGSVLHEAEDKKQERAQAQRAETAAHIRRPFRRKPRGSTTTSTSGRMDLPPSCAFEPSSPHQAAIFCGGPRAARLFSLRGDGADLRHHHSKPRVIEDGF
jgi:hypothetical protein